MDKSFASDFEKQFFNNNREGATGWFMLGRKYYKEFSQNKEKAYLELARKCFTLAAVEGPYKQLLSDGYIKGIFSAKKTEDVKSDSDKKLNSQDIPINQDDIAEGIYWLKRSAEDGNLDSQLALGLRYFYGDKIEHDSALAYKWLLTAALKDNAMAARYIGEYFDEGGWGPKEEWSPEKMLYWYKKASEGGDSWGQYLYGIEFYTGKNVKRDFKKAFELFSLSSKQKDANGTFMLAQCYWFGYGAKKDKSEAFKLFVKASDFGSAQGALDAGKVLYLGEGAERDVKTALVYFEKAAASGLQEAIDAVEICKKELKTENGSEN